MGFGGKEVQVAQNTDEAWTSESVNEEDSKTKQNKKTYQTLPWNCHAEAQMLTTTVGSNTVKNNMLLLFPRAQTKPIAAFLTFAK